ncbi:MAG: hybrid sensor histidine kinase/response regulator [Pseudomonadota bacterium]
MVDASQSQAHTPVRNDRQSRIRAIGETVARISHELNNQLTVLLGHVDLALLGADAANRDALRHVRTAGERIAKLVAALERLSVRRQPATRGVDLVAETKEAMGRFAHWTAAEGSVQLVSEHDELAVVTDPVLVHEALLHILANAVRATDERGDIDVHLGTENGQWHITVSDNGPGFDPALSGREFDPLTTTRRMPGAGLGLSHALLAMAALDGDVVIERPSGRGARVTLQAPLLPADGPVPPRTPRVLVPGQGTVLIVDDAPVALMEAYDIVAGAGYDVVLARGYSRALDQLMRGVRPDIVLAEAVLYDGGAEELAAWLAQRQQTPPVIATAFAVESPPAGSQAFAAVVTKPFDAHSLTALLAETLASLCRR